MTFLVEHPTPGKRTGLDGLAGSRGPQRMLREAMPFEVEVEDQPWIRNESYVAACVCREVFRLTGDAVGELRRFGMLRKELEKKAVAPCVCRCMGKIL